ncbi:hypothetical protein C0992_010565 [Termitomyces sp. T32_za158]|nr:hypothetical protein C0992_010565 [Termitomyces sp. T32_za158]
MLCWRRRRRRHFLPIQTVEYSFKPPLAAASGSRSSIPVQPFTLTEPAPGSRAASETTDQKYGSLPIFDIGPNILEQLHRRSWSRTGSKLRDSLGDAETQCTMATSPGSIVGDGKPPSYRA